MSILPIVADQNRTLEELADTANREFAEAGNSLSAAIVHAIRAGEALAEARDIVFREGLMPWKDWIASNLRLDYSRVHSLIQLAHHKEALPPEVFSPYMDEAGRLIQPSVNRALMYVRGLSHQKSGVPEDTWSGGGKTRHYGKRITNEIKAEVKRLRDKGLSQTETAELLGISRASVRFAENPQLKLASQKKHRARRKELAAAERALREKRQREELDRIAKEVGDAIGETYSLIRKALTKADKAQSQIETAEGRAHLRGVISHLHRAEDAIGLALKAAQS